MSVIDSEGIHQISIPFFNFQTNTYLLEGDPLTLIDTGPKVEEARTELSRALEGIGYKISDIKSIILTHGHVDHFGMAKSIQDISDANVFVHKDDMNMVSNFGDYNKRISIFYEEVLFSSGIPSGIARSLIPPLSFTNRYLDYITVINALQDQCVIAAGKFKFSVIHCPGHTPGSICLYSKERKILFSGDHLLGKITPNIGIFPNKDQSGHLSLLSYLDSLRKIENLDVKVVLPGHGQLIFDLKNRVQSTIDHHKNRKEKILHTLDEGPRTPYEITKTVFGEVSTYELFLALIETLSHIKLLEYEGKVRSIKKKGLMFFTQT